MTKQRYDASSPIELVCLVVFSDKQLQHIRSSVNSTQSLSSFDDALHEAIIEISDDEGKRLFSLSPSEILGLVIRRARVIKNLMYRMDCKHGLVAEKGRMADGGKLAPTISIDSYGDRVVDNWIVSINGCSRETEDEYLKEVEGLVDRQGAATVALGLLDEIHPDILEAGIDVIEENPRMDFHRGIASRIAHKLGMHTRTAQRRIQEFRRHVATNHIATIDIALGIDRQTGEMNATEQDRERANKGSLSLG